MSVGGIHSLLKCSQTVIKELEAPTGRTSLCICGVNYMDEKTQHPNLTHIDLFRYKPVNHN